MPKRTRASYSSVQTEAVLKSIPLFAGLPATVAMRLAMYAEVIRLPAQRWLFQAGEPIHWVHFLLDGALSRSAQLYGRSEKLLELIRPGQWLAPAEVINADRYASQAKSTEICSLLAIDRAAFIREVEQVAALSYGLLRVLAERQHALDFEVVAHHTLSGSQRLLEYLLRLAGDRMTLAGETTVRLDATKRIIAARLDMTPETFSRALQQLSRDGLIVVDSSTIHLQNAMLERSAEVASLPSRPPQRFRASGRGAARNGEERESPLALVNRCGRFRMLSQRIAVAWGMIARRIATETARANLRRLIEQFERNLSETQTLELPDGLPLLLTAVAHEWENYKQVLDQGQPAKARAAAIFMESEQLLGAADKLTSSAGDAFGPFGRLVHIAGRNRMLTAHTAKLYLLRQWGIDATEVDGLIAANRDEFAANTRFLYEQGPQTPETHAQLSIDTDEWSRFILLIDTDNTADKKAATAHLREVMSAGEKLLRHVDTTVRLYELLGTAAEAQQ